MNLFKKYGIKEVADVTFYSITEIGDERFYIPILVLDTLKVSTIEQKSTNVTADGGYANSRVISWNFGKQITLTLEDALFSAASMNMTYGWLNSKLSLYTSIITKLNLANKYGKLNYSIYAYPSPELSEEEWETVFFTLSQVYEDNQEDQNRRNEVVKNWGLSNFPDYLTEDFINEPYVAEARSKIKSYYKNRLLSYNNHPQAAPQDLIVLIYNQIQFVSDYYNIDTDNYELEVIDRMEKCVVTKDEGLYLDGNKQWENLRKYFNNDKSQSYTIYYDVKTMQPLILELDDKKIDKDNEFWLKKGTLYYKWTRTVQQKIDDKDFLGKTLVINSTTFPQRFKIVGETYIREQKTNKDSRYQFTINEAQISTDTDIKLQADGDPTTFSMSIDVLPPPNEVMMELRQFDVTEDEDYGGTKILPQQTEYTKTNLNIVDLKEKGDIKNEEIY